MGIQQHNIVKLMKWSSIIIVAMPAKFAKDMG